MDPIPVDDTLSVDSDLEATSEDIEYDEYDYENTQDDDDEDASSGNDVSVASLASSIHEYVDKHGRTYHTYFGMEKYPVPADELEQDRCVYSYLPLLDLSDQATKSIVEIYDFRNLCVNDSI
uniref:Similar to mRNA 3&apos acc. no. Q4IPA4 n=1 Tax=Pyronema omphalodes (strain CBS 100304) TaxID=1076935 RepID=U4LTU4_PYROM